MTDLHTDNQRMRVLLDDVRGEYRTWIYRPILPNADAALARRDTAHEGIKGRVLFPRVDDGDAMAVTLEDRWIDMAAVRRAPGAQAARCERRGAARHARRRA